MSGTYLTWLADAYRAAGLTVVEYQGWQTRARSSGGFAAGRPVCTMWHHTASSTTPQNDASYMCNGSSDRPIANVLIARDGSVWVLAAGATNTNGKGNALSFSTGTVPADSMNTWAIGVEIANAGTGEQYPQAQVDAMFAVSNVHAARLGWQPADLAGHVDYAPTRKIDPAVNVVAGPWSPGSINSSRSWNVADVRTEAIARASGTTPTPAPPEEDDDMRTPASAWFAGQLQGFVTGEDGALWQTWWDQGAGGWQPWTSLGGQLTSAPTCTVTADGSRIDVFARGTDNSLWQTWFVWGDPQGWNAWTPVPSGPCP